MHGPRLRAVGRGARPLGVRVGEQVELGTHPVASAAGRQSWPRWLDVCGGAPTGTPEAE